MINMTQIRLAWRQPRAHSKCTRNTDFQLPWRRVFSSRQGKCCCQAPFLRWTTRFYFLEELYIFQIQQFNSHLSWFMNSMIFIFFVLSDKMLEQTFTKELRRTASLPQTHMFLHVRPLADQPAPRPHWLSSDSAEPVWISTQPRAAPVN